jgi:hypothetical protein
MPPTIGPRRIPIRGPPITPRVICPETPTVKTNGKIDRRAWKAAKVATNAMSIVESFI